MRRLTLAGVLTAAVLGAAACSDGTPDTNAGETTAALAPAAPAAPAAAGGHSGHGMGGTMTQRDPNPSRNFALNMIEHHEGAVTMSQSAMQGELDPEMGALAQKIIGDQEREIDQMRAFLARSKPAGG
jgi:uncharacterized protein (DUF305 family)